MKNRECIACPRECGIDRSGQKGFCGMGEKIKVAHIGLHLWEEPCISCGAGSGTVFFSGCNLGCVFCQNHEISHGHQGKEMADEALAEEILGLQARGAANINLVTPSHYTEAICRILQKVKPQLKIPVIYNSSGYDSVKSLRSLEGLIDIYLPDIKYFSAEMSIKYSRAADYFSVAIEALEEMVRQTGYAQFGDEGVMNGGVLVRHLVLPGGYHDSIHLLEHLAQIYPPEQMAISLMSQYFPGYRAREYPELNRRLTSFEYKRVVERARELGFSQGFIQDLTSATEKYVPDFCYTGEDDREESPQIL